MSREELEHVITEIVNICACPDCSVSRIHKDTLEVIERLLTDEREKFRELVNDSGFHGNGEHDTEIYYCEHCKQSHEHFAKIPHKQDCIVAKARILLGKQ
jgi:hypothetical protein